MLRGHETKAMTWEHSKENERSLECNGTNDKKVSENAVETTSPQKCQTDTETKMLPKSKTDANYLSINI